MVDVGSIYEDQIRVLRSSVGVVERQIEKSKDLSNRTSRLLRQLQNRKGHFLHIDRVIKQREKELGGKEGSDEELHKLKEELWAFKKVYDKREKETDDIKKLQDIEKRIPEINNKLIKIIEQGIKSMEEALTRKVLNEEIIKQQEELLYEWHRLWEEKVKLVKELKEYEEEVREYEQFGMRFITKKIVPLIRSTEKVEKEEEKKIKEGEFTFE